MSTDVSFRLIVMRSFGNATGNCAKAHGFGVSSGGIQEAAWRIVSKSWRSLGARLICQRETEAGSLMFEVDAGSHGGEIMLEIRSKGTKVMGIVGEICLLLLLILIPGAGLAGVTKPDSVCRKLELAGEVSAGQEWSAAIGEGWMFRVVPIAGSGKGYTGWDLVVDREAGGGYPDALLLATPPYGSLNEREIGTTFGMRAQDAIAWGPRRFQFLTSVPDLAQSKRDFDLVMAGPGGLNANSRSKAAGELLKRMEGASAGRFEVLDAKLTAGVANPPAFAEQWPMHLSRVPHTLVPPSGTPTARGELHWIRFAATLWLPKEWAGPRGTHSDLAKCAQ